jgi:hypothetical protein
MIEIMAQPWVDRYASKSVESKTRLARRDKTFYDMIVVAAKCRVYPIPPNLSPVSQYNPGLMMIMVDRDSSQNATNKRNNKREQ